MPLRSAPAIQSAGLAPIPVAGGPTARRETRADSTSPARPIAPLRSCRKPATGGRGATRTSASRTSSGPRTSSSPRTVVVNLRSGCAASSSHPTASSGAPTVRSDPPAGVRRPGLGPAKPLEEDHPGGIDVAGRRGQDETATRRAQSHRNRAHPSKRPARPTQRQCQPGEEPPGVLARGADGDVSRPRLPGGRPARRRKVTGGPRVRTAGPAGIGRVTGGPTAERPPWWNLSPPSAETPIPASSPRTHSGRRDSPSDPPTRIRAVTRSYADHSGGSGRHPSPRRQRPCRSDGPASVLAALPRANSGGPAVRRTGCPRTPGESRAPRADCRRSHPRASDE